MIVNELISQYGNKLFRAAEKGEAVPAPPNLDVFLTDTGGRDKPGLPTREEGYETFGAGTEVDFSRDAVAEDRKTTLEQLFEGLEEEPIFDQPAVGGTRGLKHASVVVVRFCVRRSGHETSLVKPGRRIVESLPFLTMNTM